MANLAITFYATWSYLNLREYNQLKLNLFQNSPLFNCFIVLSSPLVWNTKTSKNQTTIGSCVDSPRQELFPLVFKFSHINIKYTIYLLSSSYSYCCNSFEIKVFKNKTLRSMQWCEKMSGFVRLIILVRKRKEIYFASSSSADELWSSDHDRSLMKKQKRSIHQWQQTLDGETSDIWLMVRV